MAKLVEPHGGKGLVCALLHGNELEAELEKAETLKKIEVSDRAKGESFFLMKFIIFNSSSSLAS